MSDDLVKRYDAGLLPDPVPSQDNTWWQNAMRSELEYAHEFYADQIKAAEAQVRELREAIVRAGRYQPTYNGRPSCPFCGNFVDDEETHLPNCIVVECRQALSNTKDKSDEPPPVLPWRKLDPTPD